MPAVTAERSPPASRMTGADSPVIADSSTLATPSTISPSPGMNCARLDAHDVSGAQRRRGHGFAAPVANPHGGRFGLRLAERRRLRLAPSLGHRLGEVGEEHGEPQPERHLAGEERLPLPPSSSCTQTMVVSTLPTSTMNITGFLNCTRGSSLMTESRIACRTMPGSQIEMRRARSVMTPSVVPGLAPHASHDRATRRAPGSARAR